MWREGFTNSELEFLAEATEIEIIPNFRKDKLVLISGVIGPFRANKTIKVPLWLAIQYKKNMKCTILPPSYLEETFLARLFEAEKDNEKSLVELPPYFFEISQILFNKSPDSFTNVDTIRGFVENLSAIRMDKINKILHSISDSSLSLNLNGFSEKELELVRPFINIIFPMRLNTYQLEQNENNPFANPIYENTNTQTSSFNSGFEEENRLEERK